MVSEDIFHFALGPYEIAVFNDFTNPQPAGQLVTGVPELEVRDALVRAGLPAEMALLDTNVMWIDTGDMRVLIDSGWGPEGKLLKLMKAAGAAPEEVDFVVITHTDGDHIGGLLHPAGGLSFPHAQYAMTRSAWDRWTSAEYLGQLPGERADLVRHLADLLRDRTALFEGEGRTAPGVNLVDAPGHRQGHAAVEISSNDGRMLHVADAILSPIFVAHPDWHCPIDTDQPQASRTREEIVARAAESGMLIASSHLPFPGLGRITRRRGDLSWNPVAGQPVSGSATGS